MTAEPLLSVRGLQAWYGRAHILTGVDLTVDRGEVVALMGRNGAGKTTTMKAIMGLLDRRSGTVAFDGRDVSALPPHRIARRGLGYVPEDRRVFTDLTVEENLEVGRQPPRDGAPHWTPERLYALFPNLAEMRGRRGGRMSGGEQQMLTLARTLMGNPSLLLLDEPSEGLAPRIVQQMADALRALKAEGLSILVSEQNLAFAAAVADRASVIEKGQIRFEGPMRTLLEDETVRRAYLAV
ncbi:ABC transporter ATP-binding protein [Azospirillum brasilense]|uniref:ABC transporter ATP-binding protein n=1 Tax=Azospirillum brasilense TaxID=192 RepID=A0A0N7I7Y9_AZOBR|nr:MULTISPECIES: ABC transporter ATP-binding protein [Azospirillum]ALJ35819.1 ABC transporter ATP-binding protein [Azospirillum brasilense]MDW7552212.1 ABC transporter ATP-binding protein [Azospirillum brasilense]MDW7597282.1 ABC transporter ATP-binding protein [Azospirillum brasilense]MDW7628708.1 ABC transporter ATP-binding protein [Azospirillum brasilense]MDX5954584.1 ABC transporter ATP-binding protein [Azospirillum brasilense]